MATVSRDAVSRAELYRIFVDELAREAPESVFVFEIGRREPGADGCNWYPLAAIGSWEGELNRSLAAFRSVRERLARDYLLADAEDGNAAAGGHVAEPATA